MSRHIYKIILSLFLVAIPIAGKPQSNIDSHRSELGIILINDTLFETDKDYTGSVGVYYKFQSIPLLIKYQIDAYTPSKKDLKLLEPREGTHPYAGFGYFGTEYRILNKNLLTTLIFKLGSTGKYSYAQELQNGLHSLINDRLFKGWDSQIQTKIGYIFNPRTEYVFHSKYFSLLPFLEIEFGNIMTTQKLGLRILSGINYNKDFLFTNLSSKPNYNVFLSYEISNVSKNVYLSGFEGYEYGVDIINAVYELKIGFDIQYRSYGLSFQNHYKSKEYMSQNKDHRFSTLVLYYKF